MDKGTTIKRAHDVLAQENTYRPLIADPTDKHKKKPINTLRKIKAEGGIGDNSCKRLYPTGAGPPKFCGLAKMHKNNPPWVHSFQ